MVDRWFRNVLVSLLVAAAGLGATTLQAQTPAPTTTPTPEQMEVFRNLPPDQQQAVLERLGNGQNGVRRDPSAIVPETVQPREVASSEEEPEIRSKEPRVRGRDTVLLQVRKQEVNPVTGRGRTNDELQALETVVARILKGNPYRLDSGGVLRLPGINPIPLAGLTEEQAAARLNGEPQLEGMVLQVNLLPLAKSAEDALQPFGYDLFAGVPSTFAPVTDVPVPAEYVVGPGDRLEIQMLGSAKGRYSLVVNRDGRVMFPELGPIAVSGMRFEEAASLIESRVAAQMIGAKAVVSMGDLRSIRVFVLGEAERPGSYTVSGLATITNALFASGGVKAIGSLRNIQLKRNGEIITRLDLYDLLLNGDTSDDVRLLPGDVIFIPPVGSTVGVTGEIRRPAIYELKGESTAADLLYLGGGLTPEADPRLATIERIDERRERVVIDVDLGNPQARSLRLRSGDLLRIPATRPTLANEVRVEGHVHRPGSFQYRNGMRLSDLLPSVDELKPNADLHYVVVRRENAGNRRVEALSADLSRAWAAPGSDADPLLAPRDRIYVFDFTAGRAQFIKPLVEELERQATALEPSQVVHVWGGVRAAGAYPLEQGMRVSSLVRAGGGLSESALRVDAELVRYEVIDGLTRRTAVTKVDVERALAGDDSANLVLQPFDTLVVKDISEWAEGESVRVDGEVRFPGAYPIRRGETLRSVIERAGGLTSLAFTQGAVFSRDTLKERERQQMRVLADRLRQDLTSLALQSSQGGGQAAAAAGETFELGQSMLRDLMAAEPLGRLVIDLDLAINAEQGSPADVELRGGDRLFIPKRMQEVTVIGEVQSATSHLYDPALTRADYLRMSGGTTQRADDGRIYVIRANGGVEMGNSSRWFGRDNEGIRPGDTIVVPIDAERMRPLTTWTAVSTILFNIAVAVAAVNSF